MLHKRLIIIGTLGLAKTGAKLWRDSCADQQQAETCEIELFEELTGIFFIEKI